MADDHGESRFSRTAIGLMSASAALLTGLGAFGIKLTRDDSAHTPRSEPAGAGTTEPTDDPITTTTAITVEPTVDPEPPATPEPTTPATVVASVLPGLRPQLGQVSEYADLYVDDVLVGSWALEAGTVDTSRVDMEVEPGTHSYALVGTYEYQDFTTGYVLSAPVSGSGTIAVAGGEAFAVSYNPDGTFSLG